MKLSILICTIDDRRGQFDKLLNHLLDSFFDVESDRYKIQDSEKMGFASSDEMQIIWYRDNKEMIIGDKRQKLLEAARGDYIVFIDDDDWVADDYVEQILKAIEQKPDCIGFLINCNMNGKYESAIASSRYKQWGDNQDGYRYNRSIYHKTPVRRDIALKAGFPSLNYGEDAEYSRRVMRLLKDPKEVFIDKELYYFRYKPAPHKEKYGM